jgi:hypothetical protein
VRGRLWRTSNPALSDGRRQALVDELMDARRAIKDAKGDDEVLGIARRRVHSAKVELGERGRVWWDDGASDLNRYMIENTGYRDWYLASEIADAITG